MKHDFVQVVLRLTKGELLLAVAVWLRETHFTLRPETSSF